MSKTERVKRAALKPFFFRLKGPEAEVLDRRVDTVCRMHHLDRNDLAREGLKREIARLEAKAAAIDPALLRTVSEAQRLGIDVQSVLTQALKSAAA